MIREAKLLELARDKGFRGDSDNVTGDFLTLCCIQKWLMDEHNIYIAVLPGFGGFSFTAGTQKNLKITPNSFNMGAYETWPIAYLQAIEAALNLLTTK